MTLVLLEGVHVHHIPNKIRVHENTCCCSRMYNRVACSLRGGGIGPTLCGEHSCHCYHESMLTSPYIELEVGLKLWEGVGSKYLGFCTSTLALVGVGEQ